MKQKKKKSAETLQSIWTTVNGLKLHAHISTCSVPADAPAIVLVHGYLVSGRYMLPVTRHLAPYYRVYVPDLPGFGKSENPSHVLNIAELADALAAWMQAIGLEKATLLGNSMGCQIIGCFALRYPELLERVILVGPTIDATAHSYHQTIWKWLITLTREPISLYAVLFLDTLDFGVWRAIRTLQYALRDHIEQHLPSIHVPTLIVRGSRDHLASQQWVEEAAQLVPDSRLLSVNKAAHAINYNSPEKLASAVHAFINDTSNRQPQEIPGTSLHSYNFPL